jgi:hypothetical protein
MIGAGARGRAPWPGVRALKRRANVTKLRKHAAAIALAGLLALFGTACASDDGGEGGESEAGASEPAATSEAAS